MSTFFCYEHSCEFSLLTLKFSFLDRLVRVKAAKIIEKNQDAIPNSVKQAIQQARTVEEVNDLVKSYITWLKEETALNSRNAY